MELEPPPIDDQYFTYHGRLASFQKTTKKRGSTVKGAKTLNWPHKTISPESLALAGFFFQPWAENSDNVVCFLCHKAMDGWEEGDNPLLEHLKHSPSCGWAISTAVEAGLEGFDQVHPAETIMVDARKATFAGRWPHDGKRGWTCKTKQLVEAGWKYTPTPDSNDNATCAYCGLGLDGWEPKDKPYDEHFKRSPDCPFFTLSSLPNPSKKKGRGKAARGSKASRLSTQSVAASEAPSVADTTIATSIAGDDTVLTTVSTMTDGPKRGRPKKAATKSKKAKTKKDEPTEPEIETPQFDEPRIEEPQVEEAPEQSPQVLQTKKATRGKKRGSDAVDESTLTVASEAPARKKKATKGRGSVATEGSVMQPVEDEEMLEAPALKKGPGRKKGLPSAAKSKTRKTSTASITSIVSFEEVPLDDFPDDDEIERQLEADLERPLTDDEDITADSDSERNKAKAKAKASVPKPKDAAPAKKSTHHAMFEPTPPEMGDEEVEGELDALRAEMEVDKSKEDLAPEMAPLQVAKKGRKAGTRKASKETARKTSRSTKTKKAKSPEPPVEEDLKLVGSFPEPDEVMDEADASLGSTDTVVKSSEPSRPAAKAKNRSHAHHDSVASQSPTEADELADEPVVLPTTKTTKASAKMSANSRSSAASQEDKSAKQPAKRGRGRPPKASVESKSAEAEAQLREEAIAAATRAKAETIETDPAEPEEEAEIYEEAPELISIHESPIAPSSVSQQHAQAPSTPRYGVSPSASARQAVLSPSQSPQPSDAENEPPSSKHAASVTTKRIALAPIDTTPVRLSPSKRNVLAGLQSKTPWKPLDLDNVLGTPSVGMDKENGVERLLRKGKELTSPEKQMTVEEWIYFNAAEAQKLLKHQCETMVSRFESEGSKAMNVLEELVTE